MLVFTTGHYNHTYCKTRSETNPLGISFQPFCLFKFSENMSIYSLDVVSI